MSKKQKVKVQMTRTEMDYDKMSTIRSGNINITTGSQYPIKEWTVGVPVEDSARRQLFNIASMPFVHKHVAVMPDVHFGRGATVGSVIATNKAIIPAAVGVDLGCVDADTEFLTPTGWKSIADYKDGDEVLVFNREKECASFEKAKHVKLDCDEFWHIKTKYGVNQMLSDEHTVLYYKYTRDYKFDQSATMTAEELANKHNSLKLGFRGRLLTSFEYTGVRNDFSTTSIELTDAQIRVMVMVCAEGSFYSSSFSSTRCRLRLVKPRKVQRAKELLEDAGIYFESKTKAEPSVSDRLVHTITFDAPEKLKSLSYFWKASPEQLKIICDEVFHWDGNFDNSVFFTRDKASADFMSFAFAACGKRSVMREDIDQSDGKVNYRVFAHSNTKVGIAASPEKQEFVRVPSPDGFKYCFTTSTGYWVMRRGGVIAVTGNCGMAAVKLSINASQLPDNLSELRSVIESVVPHGRTNNGGQNDRGSWGDYPKEVEAAWMGLEGGYKKITQKYPKIFHNRALNQLGTLGSGNHFYEVCVGEDQGVWVMLHSGSRGPGNAIGSFFIEKAKEEMMRYFISLPDQDLAYLPEGSIYFNDYIESVSWAQEYAKTNREVMLDKTLKAIKKSKILPKFEVEESAINCFRGDTKFITSNGVKSLSDVAGSTVKLLTSTGKWVNAPIRSFGEQKIVKLTLGRYDVTKTIYTTAEHNWFIDTLQRKRFTKLTVELEPGDRLAFQSANKTFNGFDSLFQYRGFTFGDGSTCSVNTSLANFCGPKTALLERFRDLIGNEPRVYGDIIRVTGLPGNWKRSTEDLFNASPDEIVSWLSGYFAANGDIDKTGRPTITSSKREHLEVYRDLCWKIGIVTYPIRVFYRTGYGDEDTPIYLMGLSRNDLSNDFFLREDHRVRLRSVHERLNWKVLSVESTDFVEEVFCAEVDETHSFVLEDGILTSNCHHNYIAKENHFGSDVWVTRKGAVRARQKDLAIIPGSMGAKSFIVRGLGNPESFCSCSHGAGRVMSRSEAKKRFTLKDHREATKGVECRKDKDVIDETPKAYKDIESVMAAQSDLVEVVHTIKQVLCVKG